MALKLSRHREEAVYRAAHSQRKFAQYAWAVLVYNFFVVLWGAYVRASKSGAGCGDNWPFCNGQWVPHSRTLQTIIEYVHRMTSVVDTIAIVALCVWAFSIYPRAHRCRKLSLYALAFLLIEALLGAGLVLLRYTGNDESAGRVWYLSAHLTNTMVLLGVLAALAWMATTGTERVRLRNAPRLLLWALPVTLAIAISGAMAALGDTLFPAQSLATGVSQDFSNTASWLVRLRLLHPAFALIGAGYLLWTATSVLKGNSSPARAAAMRVLSVTLFQLAVGAVNITLLAPIWMQLFHLLVADVLWIAVLLLVLETARVPQPIEELIHA